LSTEGLRCEFNSYRFALVVQLFKYLSSYMAYSPTQDEARNIMMEIKEYMKSRKGVLDRSDAVIISN